MSVVGWFVRLFMHCFFPGWDASPTIDDVRHIWCGKADQ